MSPRGRAAIERLPATCYHPSPKPTRARIEPARPTSCYVACMPGAATEGASACSRDARGPAPHEVEAAGGRLQRGARRASWGAWRRRGPPSAGWPVETRERRPPTAIEPRVKLLSLSLDSPSTAGVGQDSHFLVGHVARCRNVFWDLPGVPWPHLHLPCVAGQVSYTSVSLSSCHPLSPEGDVNSPMTDR